MKTLAILATAAVLSVSALAQTPSIDCKDVPKPAPGQNVTCFQKALMGSIQSQLQVIYQQAGVAASPLATEKSKLVQQIVSQNPGYTWATDPRTGEDVGLQPIAKPPAPAPAPTGGPAALPTQGTAVPAKK